MRELCPPSYILEFSFHCFLPPVTTFAPQRSGLRAPGSNPSVHRSTHGKRAHMRVIVT